LTKLGGEYQRKETSSMRAREQVLGPQEENIKRIGGDLPPFNIGDSGEKVEKGKRSRLWKLVGILQHGSG